MKRLAAVINLILCLNIVFGSFYPVLTYAQDTGNCTYNETAQNCASGGTRTCRGTDEGSGCHYNPDIDPACKESCNCTFNENPQNCPNGGTRTCQGSDEGEGCHYNEAVDPACQEICTPSARVYPDASGGNSAPPAEVQPADTAPESPLTNTASLTKAELEQQIARYEAQGDQAPKNLTDQLKQIQQEQERLEQERLEQERQVASQMQTAENTTQAETNPITDASSQDTAINNYQNAAQNLADVQDSASATQKQAEQNQENGITSAVDIIQNTPSTLVDAAVSAVNTAGDQVTTAITSISNGQAQQEDTELTKKADQSEQQAAQSQQEDQKSLDNFLALTAEDRAKQANQILNLPPDTPPSQVVNVINQRVSNSNRQIQGDLSNPVIVKKPRIPGLGAIFINTDLSNAQKGKIVKDNLQQLGNITDQLANQLDRYNLFKNPSNAIQAYNEAGQKIYELANNYARWVSTASYEEQRQAQAQIAEAAAKMGANAATFGLSDLAIATSDITKLRQDLDNKLAEAGYLPLDQLAKDPDKFQQFQREMTNIQKLDQDEIQQVLQGQTVKGVFMTNGPEDFRKKIELFNAATALNNKIQDTQESTVINAMMTIPGVFLPADEIIRAAAQTTKEARTGEGILGGLFGRKASQVAETETEALIQRGEPLVVATERSLSECAVGMNTGVQTLASRQTAVLGASCIRGIFQNVNDNLGTRLNRTISNDAKELPIVSAPKGSGYAYLTEDTARLFKFPDHPNFEVKLSNGEMFNIANSYFDVGAHYVVPIRMPDGKVSFAYLSTSEGNWKWFVGETKADWIVKPGQEYLKNKAAADVPSILNSKLMNSLADGTLETRAGLPTEAIGMLYSSESEGTAIMAKRLADADVRFIRYNEEVNGPLLGKLDVSKAPESLSYNPILGTIQANYVNEGVEYTVHFQVVKKPGVNIPIMNFTVKPLGDPDVVVINAPMIQRGADIDSNTAELIGKAMDTPLYKAIQQMKDSAVIKEGYRTKQHPGLEAAVQQFVQMNNDNLSGRMTLQNNGGWSAARPQSYVPQIILSHPLTLQQTKSKEDSTSFLLKILGIKKVFAKDDKNKIEQTSQSLIAKNNYLINASLTDIKDKLSTQASMSAEELKNIIKKNNQIKPIGLRTKDEIIVSTGDKGTVEFEVEPGTYFLETSEIDKVKLIIPQYIQINQSSGSVVLPIGIKADDAGISKVSPKIFPDIRKKNSNAKPKIKIIIFNDKKGDGKWDQNDKGLPWAGVTIMLKKASKDKVISLLNGWNLITLTALPEKPLTASSLITEIAKQGGYATSVSTLDNGAWKTYITRGDKQYSKDDFPIELGKAYFVKSAKKSVFIFQGQELVSPVKLAMQSGWNAIGLPKTTIGHISDLILTS